MDSRLELEGFDTVHVTVRQLGDDGEGADTLTRRATGE
jgi:hypothetical protein